MTTSQPTLNVVTGLPDDGLLQVTHFEGTAMKFALSGTASFIEHLPGRPWNLIWVGRRAPAHSEMLPGPVINYIAEADRCRAALTAASDIAGSLNRPWFNHPDRVVQTTRDGVSDLLCGIEGLDVPRTVRVQPRVGRDVIDAIDSHRLGYPVLVRAVGEHGSHSLVRLDGPDGKDRLFALPWGGRAIYITQYRDFAGSDGLYCKVRLAVIGGHPYIRHAMFADDWDVAPAKRSQDERLLGREAAMMTNFNATLLPLVLPTVRAIAERLRLDFFGIDCAIQPDGTMILFEANANMTMLRLLPGTMWEPAVLAIRAAVLALIDDPVRWAAA